MKVINPYTMIKKRIVFGLLLLVGVGVQVFLNTQILRDELQSWALVTLPFFGIYYALMIHYIIIKIK